MSLPPVKLLAVLKKTDRNLASTLRREPVGLGR